MIQGKRRASESVHYSFILQGLPDEKGACSTMVLVDDENKLLVFNCFNGVSQGQALTKLSDIPSCWMTWG